MVKDILTRVGSALGYAHRRGVVHRDIKPGNVMIDEEGTAIVTDFGIAKVAARTRTTSSAGTIGYLAPEQALGRPSARSDVFSLGLVLYRMFSGVLPSWPYQWPLEGQERLRRHLSPGFIELLRKAVQVDDRKRFRDAGQMLAALRRIKGRALRDTGDRRKHRGKAAQAPGWRSIRFREFRRRHGRVFAARSTCRACGGPVAEAMVHCPWCGKARGVHKDGTSFPRVCKRCGRGQKGDWRFCGWCYGPSTGYDGPRRYSDRRYVAKCASPSCRGPLMPFMRYCPWCRVRVRKKWSLAGSKRRCRGCGWEVLPDFWDFCPWCGKGQGKRR
jgi:hypothetical protein